MWSSPNTYCPIGASFCLEEFFAFSLTSARYERMFGIFPKIMGGAYLRSGEAIEADNWNDAVFKFEDVLRNREDDTAPPALDDPKLRLPEVPVDVPDNPRNEIPDDPRRHEDPNVPVPPTPDPRLEEPILAPEPSTLVLLGATLPLAIGFIRGRRKR
jgi:hypothetical protein